MNGIDAGMTVSLTRLGVAKEINPVMAFLLWVHPAAFVVGKSAIIIALAYYIEKNSHDKNIRRLTYGAAAVFTALIVYSLWALLSL